MGANIAVNGSRVLDQPPCCGGPGASAGWSGLWVQAVGGSHRPDALLTLLSYNISFKNVNAWFFFNKKRKGRQALPPAPWEACGVCAPSPHPDSPRGRGQTLHLSAL